MVFDVSSEFNEWLAGGLHASFFHLSKNWAVESRALSFVFFCFHFTVSLPPYHLLALM